MSEPQPPTLAEMESLAKGTLGADAKTLYAHFKYLVHDVKGRAAWQALQVKDEKLNRDTAVVRVWAELQKSHGPEIKRQYHSLGFHRLWLFDWLLRRYDVRRARSVMGGGWFAQNAHVFLLVAVAVVYALRRLGSFRTDQTKWSILLCAISYVFVLSSLTYSFRDKRELKPRDGFAAATHSLIPRLAGAAVVGLLFLASSLELFRVALDTKLGWLLALLLAVYGYLLLEMSRRVHPLPPFRRLALHAFDISTTALAHSVTLTLVSEGVLRKLLGRFPGDSRPPFGWCESFSLVVFVFSIGLVVNLIWAEQPVTEPL